SRLMTQGIDLINGEQHIKVEEALLSIGNLAPAVIKKINRLKTGKFKVQWKNGLINALTLNTDKLTMMLYNETLDQFIAISDVGNRIDKYAHFSIPTNWDKGTVYFWSMWKAADGSVNSTSCFHGIIELDNIEEETGNEEQKTRNGEQETGNGELEAEKREQEAENGNQEISEVISIEQAREIALKQHLEEIDTSTKAETTPSLKEDTIPPLNQQQKDGETTASPINTSKDKKVKKWTPPGYIRKVNKEIIKQPNASETELQTDQMNEKLNNEPRSILEFDSIREEQRE
ncbi:DUF6266 family protein, partial [Myroides sp. N17-2]|uniref:DUF6266 family protein n=1 Tax=Myroides sp. N17-2 TaxID=2030799 RepID=UPI001304093A